MILAICLIASIGIAVGNILDGAINKNKASVYLGIAVLITTYIFVQAVYGN